MLHDIEREIAATRVMTGKANFANRVINALEKVPRHEFVPPDMRSYAYDNGPASIGYGQTISQPYIVGLMTDLLSPKEDDTILEVGTGSGYQAAVLSQIVKRVFSIEIIKELGEEAADRLKRLGYNNVAVRVGDGYYGWQDHAPFDGIIVTAAAPHIPRALVEQLKPGGRLVLPVGFPYMHQELMVIKKDEKGETKTRDVLAVAFVPLTGKHDLP